MEHIALALLESEKLPLPPIGMVNSNKFKDDLPYITFKTSDGSYGVAVDKLNLDKVSDKVKVLIKRTNKNLITPAGVWAIIMFYNAQAKPKEKVKINS